MSVENKTILTRIINKNASLAEWNSSDLVLKQGEIALAYVETKQEKADNNGNITVQYVPTYLMKIGDGEHTFKDVNWLAAPASDVYDWAKKSALAYDDLPESAKTALAAVDTKLDASTYTTFINDVFTPFKKVVDDFFNDQAEVDGLVDTLVEIQKLLDGTEGAQSLVNAVAALQAWYDAHHAKLEEIENWYTAKKEAIEGALTASHTHSNKELLDTYDQTNADLTDAVTKKHSHTFVESELNKIKDGDVDNWNGIEGRVDTKLENYVQHSSTTIEYILDCGNHTVR